MISSIISNNFQNDRKKQKMNEKLLQKPNIISQKKRFNYRIITTIIGFGKKLYKVTIFMIFFFFFRL